jgi:hypothetical protein
MCLGYQAYFSQYKSPFIDAFYCATVDMRGELINNETQALK